MPNFYERTLADLFVHTMAPAVYRSGRARRQPLVPASPVPVDIVSTIRDIFNNSQHPGTSEAALEGIKKIYKNTDLKQFQGPFTDCLRKLLQSEHNQYFKSACSFVCRFLEFVSKQSDESKPKNENAGPRAKKAQKQTKKQRQTSKRFKPEESGSEDELVGGFIKKEKTFDEESMDSDSSPASRPEARITAHDKLISACANIAHVYRVVFDDTCRLNAVFFIYRFLSSVESLDEGICNAIKPKLLQSLRDKRPLTRAYAVLALRTFQDEKLTQEGFKYHFERDPELAVRRPLLKIMDPKVFGHEFLVTSTRDPSDSMRKLAYQRLNEISPKDLRSEHLHRIIHNGLSERDLQVAHKFKTQTLWPWLSTLYDGLDLHKMLEPFDVANHVEDITCLLNTIYDHDLQEPQSNGTSTKLHHVVENFRERWLSEGTNCLPNVEKVDERLVTVWFSLVKFCKDNQPIIESVRIRTVRAEGGDPNESIEQILESQENREESIELYERLCPDLVNLVEFLNRYIRCVGQQLDAGKITPERAEFTYLQIMDFITTYEVGDELERKTVQEVFDTILKESLLVQHLESFIPPIIKCLYKLVYSRSSNLMVNYIAELIQNVRSHLEDLSPSTTPDEPKFKDHPSELIKCLQMYLGCLQIVRVKEVPETMLSHLQHLSFESLEEWYINNSRIRCLMVACNGVTGLVHEGFVLNDFACLNLLAASCYDHEHPMDVKTTAFKCLVDVICQHDNIEFPENCERFLIENLESYGEFDTKETKKEKLEFISAVIVGTTKLFYHQKLKSPDLLAFLIIWWYHPSTPSKLKQFIGIFLPVFVNDLMKESHIAESLWFRELLMNTFVISIETIHSYILEAGYDLLVEKDILNLISFLSNLIPVSLHPGIAKKVNQRICELGEDQQDLLKYLEKSKLSLVQDQPKPTSDELNASEPLADEPVVDEPAADEEAADEEAAEECAADEPADEPMDTNSNSEDEVD